MRVSFEVAAGTQSRRRQLCTYIKLLTPHKLQCFFAYREDSIAKHRTGGLFLSLIINQTSEKTDFKD